MGYFQNNARAGVSRPRPNYIYIHVYFSNAHLYFIK